MARLGADIRMAFGVILDGVAAMSGLLAVVFMLAFMRLGCVLLKRIFEGHP